MHASVITAAQGFVSSLHPFTNSALSTLISVSFLGLAGAAGARAIRSICRSLADGFYGFRGRRLDHVERVADRKAGDRAAEIRQILGLVQGQAPAPINPNVNPTPAAAASPDFRTGWRMVRIKKNSNSAHYPRSGELLPTGEVVALNFLRDEGDYLIYECNAFGGSINALKKQEFEYVS
jgi:hypothetical protein